MRKRRRRRRRRRRGGGSSLSKQRKRSGPKTRESVSTAQLHSCHNSPEKPIVPDRLRVLPAMLQVLHTGGCQGEEVEKKKKRNKKDIDEPPTASASLAPGEEEEGASISKGSQGKAHTKIISHLAAPMTTPSLSPPSKAQIAQAQRSISSSGGGRRRGRRAGEGGAANPGADQDRRGADRAGRRKRCAAHCHVATPSTRFSSSVPSSVLFLTFSSFFFFVFFSGCMQRVLPRSCVSSRGPHRP
jgi:hypothetical protein